MPQPGMFNTTASPAYPLQPTDANSQIPRESYQPEPPPTQTQYGMFGNTLK